MNDRRNTQSKVDGTTIGRLNDIRKGEEDGRKYEGKSREVDRPKN